MMLIMESHVQSVVPQFIPTEDSGLYMLVSGFEGGEPVEMPVENDGSVLLSNIQSQFPSAIGLKFRNPVTKAFRAIKLMDGYLFPPNSQNGWGEQMVYIVNTAGAAPVTSNTQGENKRKLNVCEENGEFEEIKKKKKFSKAPQCSDLIVLGLPYHTTEADLKQFFSEYGEVAFVDVKRTEGKSRGFGFIRFASFEDQKKVQNHSFTLDTRKIEVKKPTSQGGGESCRVFVGRLTDKIVKSDLVNYFEQYGAVHNVHYDHGRKQFAFVEFEDPEVAEVVLREKTHLIDNHAVLVNTADPIDKSKYNPYLSSTVSQQFQSGFIPNGTQQNSQQTLSTSYSTPAAYGWLQDGVPEYEPRTPQLATNGTFAMNTVNTAPTTPRLGNTTQRSSTSVTGLSMDSSPEPSIFGNEMMSVMAKMMAGAVAQHLASQSNISPVQAMSSVYETSVGDQMTSVYGKSAQTVGFVSAADRMDSKFLKR